MEQKVWWRTSCEAIHTRSCELTVRHTTICYATPATTCQAGKAARHQRLVPRNHRLVSMACHRVGCSPNIPVPTVVVTRGISATDRLRNKPHRGVHQTKLGTTGMEAPRAGPLAVHREVGIEHGRQHIVCPPIVVPDSRGRAVGRKQGLSPEIAGHPTMVPGPPGSRSNQA